MEFPYRHCKNVQKLVYFCYFDIQNQIALFDFMYLLIIFNILHNNVFFLLFIYGLCCWPLNSVFFYSKTFRDPAKAAFKGWKQSILWNQFNMIFVPSCSRTKSRPQLTRCKRNQCAFSFQKQVECASLNL